MKNNEIKIGTRVAAKLHSHGEYEVWNVIKIESNEFEEKALVNYDNFANRWVNISNLHVITKS